LILTGNQELSEPSELNPKGDLEKRGTNENKIRKRNKEK